jgi:hypothetical protein
MHSLIRRSQLLPNKSECRQLIIFRGIHRGGLYTSCLREVYDPKLNGFGAAEIYTSFAIPQFVICSMLQKLEVGVRSAEAEARCRYSARRDYLESRDCGRDDPSLAFADQAIVEAEVRVSTFYKGESQEKKHLRRLEGAGLFAALSSPCHVERLWG